MRFEFVGGIWDGQIVTLDNCPIEFLVPARSSHTCTIYSCNESVSREDTVVYVYLRQGSKYLFSGYKNF